MITSSRHPTARCCYIYCLETGELLATTQAPLSSASGTYSVPANATLIEPPDTQLIPFKSSRFDARAQRWEVISDFRRVMLYSKSTSLPVANTLSLGDPLPFDVTTCAPIAFSAEDHCRNAWLENRNCWRLEPDFSGVRLWDKSDGSPSPGIPAGAALPGHLTTVTPTCSGPNQRFDDMTGEWIRSDPPSELPDDAAASVPLP